MFVVYLRGFNAAKFCGELGRIIIPEILRECCGRNLAAKSVVDNYVDKYVDNFG